MYRFWKPVIEPIFSILKPRIVVEIGSEHGNNTKNLLEYCQKYDATLHSIDPLPKFDVSKWGEEYENTAVFHAELSLNALPKIDRMDAVLIDGDHNWYTVFHELKFIEKSSKRNKHPFPLVLLHDIGWPYGRRDLYYNPDNIPEAYRKPYKKLGIKPGNAELAEQGGLNPHLYNAIYENDLKNGVLTAVENFLEDAKIDLELIKIQAISGLGILFPVGLRANNPDFWKFMESLQASPAISALIEQVESARIDSEIAQNEIKKLKGIEIDQLREQVAKLEQSQRIAENELIQFRSDIEASKETLLEKDRAIADFSDRLVEADQKKNALKNEITQLTSSVEASSKTLIEKDREIAELADQMTAKERAEGDREKKIAKLQLDCRSKNKELSQNRNEISKKDKQISSYQLEMANNKDTIYKLTRWVEQLDHDTTDLLNSWRWKIGNTFARAVEIILLRRKVPIVTDHIRLLLEEFNEGPKGCTEQRKIGGSTVALKNLDTMEPTNSFRPHNERYVSIHDCLRPYTDRSNNTNVFNKRLGRMFEKEQVEAILERLQGTGTISIIVPIYNAYQLTRKCIESIFKHTTAQFQLILVDDASTDPRIDSLLREYETRSQVRVLRNGSNLGFVNSINRGIRTNKNDVILLNSDTHVTPRWLQKMIIAAYSDSKIATVTPFSNAAGAFSVPEIGKNEEIPCHLTLLDMATIIEKESDLAYFRTPTGNGYCMYVKRAVIEERGLFDSENFGKGYCEENDFCMRAHYAGWIHVIDDATFIYHHRSASFSDEKDKLIKKNRALLDSLHPEYSNLVRKFVQLPGLEEHRRRLGETIDKFPSQQSSYNKRILFVLHEGGGGVPNTSLDLIRNISDKYSCYTLTSDTKCLRLRQYSNGKTSELCNWKLKSTWSCKDITNQEFKQIYFNVLSNLNIDIVHIRHLFKHTFDIPHVAKALGISVVISFHDFYYVCPTVHLLDSDLKFCEGRCNGNDKKCNIPTPLLGDLPPLRSWLPIWRESARQVFSCCDLFVTTSDIPRSIYVDNYPDLVNKRFVVIEHGRDFPHPKGVMYEPPTLHQKVKILILGNMDIHKGSEFVKELKRIDNKRNNILEFHFLGRIDPSLKGLDIDHGQYKREELMEKIRQIRPSFVGIFSIWPETYCHTLTEAWACGVPVLGSRIGVIAERINGNGGGWLLDFQNVEVAYEQILAIISKPDEYFRVAKQIKDIPTKSTYRMAMEYDSEYTCLLASGTKKEKTKDPISILAVTPSGTDGYPGSSFIRILLPFSHSDFISSGFSTYVNSTLTSQIAELPKETLREVLKGSNIKCVILQRDVWMHDAAEKLIELCRSEKIGILFDIDDDLMSLEETHPEAIKYNSKSETVKFLLQNADLVTVSTLTLKDHFSKFNSNINVIKNTLDERLWFSPITGGSRKRENLDVKVGYMGTFTHQEDLQAVKGSLLEAKRRLKKDHHISLSFCVIGGMKSYFKTASWYDRVRIPDSCKVYPHFVKWLRRSVDWDFAIAPLVDNKFNEAKSELKYLEYSALGLPGIYAKVGAFTRTIEHLKNGIVVEMGDEEGWVDWLVELSLNHDLREQIARNARDHVIGEYLLKNQVKSWTEAIESLCG